MPNQLPIDFDTWLSKLVYEPKREYARQFAEAVINDRQLPMRPSTANWVPKCERRVIRILRPFL